MVAARVFLDPELAGNTLFHFKHTLELIDDISIISLVHSFRFDFDARLSDMEINSTVKAVAFVAHWTVELAFVFNEGVITSRGRAPTQVVNCVDGFTYRHLVKAIKHFLCHNTV